MLFPDDLVVLPEEFPLLEEDPLTAELPDLEDDSVLFTEVEERVVFPVLLRTLSPLLLVRSQLFQPLNGDLRDRVLSRRSRKSESLLSRIPDCF